MYKGAPFSPVCLEQSSFCIIPVAAKETIMHIMSMVCDSGEDPQLRKAAPRKNQPERLRGSIPNTSAGLLPATSTRNGVSLGTGASPTFFTTVSPVPGTRKHSMNASWTVTDWQ